MSLILELLAEEDRYNCAFCFERLPGRPDSPLCPAEDCIRLRTELYPEPQPAPEAVP